MGAIYQLLCNSVDIKRDSESGGEEKKITLSRVKFPFGNILMKIRVPIIITARHSIFTCPASLQKNVKSIRLISQKGEKKRKRKKKLRKYIWINYKIHVFIASIVEVVEEGWGQHLGNKSTVSTDKKIKDNSLGNLRQCPHTLLQRCYFTSILSQRYLLSLFVF